MFNQLEGVNEFCKGNVKYLQGVSYCEDQKKESMDTVFVFL